jgi:hypothetical protein
MWIDTGLSAYAEGATPYRKAEEHRIILNRSAQNRFLILILAMFTP